MNRIHWVALAAVAGVGIKTLNNLRTHFGALESVFEASREELLRVRGIGPVTADAIQALDLAAITQEVTRLEKKTDIQIVTWMDWRSYPINLRTVNDAPPVLFVRGKLSPLDAQAVAIVGTRQPSRDSKILAQKLGFQLAKRGWTVVSGLAFGIDAAAHQGALEAKGRTLAVLGSGLDRIYPSEHQALAHQIQASGALLAEVPPNRITVNAQRLVARNRIISGLAQALIVVEAGKTTGGSMHTARHAKNQQRPIFAVASGDVGCIQLLEEGAQRIHPDHLDWDALAAQIIRHSQVRKAKK